MTGESGVVYVAPVMVLVRVSRVGWVITDGPVIGFQPSGGAAATASWSNPMATSHEESDGVYSSAAPAIAAARAILVDVSECVSR